MAEIQKFDCSDTKIPRRIVSVLRKLKYDLTQIESVKRIVLFGSYSKGTYDKNSDIDIAVFVDDSVKEKMSDIFREAAYCIAKYPLDIQILVFSESMLAEPVGIVEEIVLYGKDIKSL
ncbi:MAG: nucleotidyltransferase domain-containing protein [Clostridia bacterium]